MAQDLEARLQRLEDLDAIRQLFIDYGYYLDTCDFASYASLFAEDAELLLGPVARAKGRAAIRDAMEKQLGGSAGRSFHVIANPIIKLDGDRATTDVTWVVVGRNADGKPTVPMIGRHRDVVVRTSEGWRFQRREGLIDIPSKYESRA